MTTERRVLAVDIGGTHTKVLVVAVRDGDMEELQRAVVDTPPGSPQDTVARLADHLQPLVDEWSPGRVATAVPGVVDESRGVVHNSVNLGWSDVPLGDLLRERLRLPARVIQDARAGALAEARVGAGADERDVFVLALGTGVAGAHVVDGHVRAGAHGHGGEVGHVVLRPGGRRCPCGQRGCVQAYVGGGSLREQWIEQGGQPTDSARDIIDASRSGDATAGALIDTSLDVLADLVLVLSTLVDPAVVVMGGGMSRARDVFIDPLVPRLQHRATFHTLPEIRPSTLAGFAGAWGAALAASQAGTPTER